MHQISKSDLLGEVIKKRYILEAILGNGAMGVVYRARHIPTGERVAIKLLFRQEGEERSTQDLKIDWARFDLEAKVIDSLDHENIVGIYDRGVFEFGRSWNKRQIPYIAMEYIEGGRTLADALNAHIKMHKEPFRLPEVLGYMKQMCRALASVHKKGYVHRDLKPENILLDPAGRIVIADFGITHVADSRLTATGDRMGTPGYWAPEQKANAKDVDLRADIYALGQILRELLMGPPPSRRIMEIASQPLTPEIDAVLRKATAPEREDRYENVYQFLDALYALYHDRTLDSYDSTPLPRVRPQTKSVRRYRQRAAFSLPDLPWSPALLAQLPGWSRWLLLGGLVALVVMSCLFVSARTFSASPLIQQSWSGEAAISPSLEDAKATVIRYYQLWNQRKYQDAYALLDASYQRDEAYQDLLQYYVHTQKSCVTINQTMMVSNTQARIDITDTALEESAGGATATNVYGGYYLANYSQAGQSWTLIPHLQLISMNGTCL